jgi:hypothetical protein
MRLATHPATAFLLLLCLLTAAPRAAADTWTETGDAGENLFGVQTTIGTTPLTAITGTLEAVGDRDLFCIRIIDRLAFTARRLCGAVAEPDLWLFATTGIGLSHMDGCSAGDTRVSGAFVPAPGNYILGVSGNDAQALGLGNLPIWSAASQAFERSPDGFGAPGPLSGWALQSQAPAPQPYTILLTGCVPCDGVVPAPTTSWGTLKLRYR